MSNKSLLQIILLLLIMIIIGSIYFVYFYSKQINSKINFSQDSEVNDTNLILQSESKDKLEIKQNEDKIEKNSIKNNNIQEKNDLSKNSEVKNLTKEIEYTTTNKNGDVFKLLAKYGKTNIKNNSELDLEEVKGTIVSKEKSTIYLNSDFAKYNYSNQKSNFFRNVEIIFDDKIINCDNFDLNINDNIAVAYNNVIITSNKSTMKAQTITLNTITKDIIIKSDKKVEIKKE